MNKPNNNSKPKDKIILPEGEEFFDGDDSEFSCGKEDGEDDE